MPQRVNQHELSWHRACFAWRGSSSFLSPLPPTVRTPAFLLLAGLAPLSLAAQVDSTSVRRRSDAAAAPSLTLRSVDGEYEIRFRGLIQSDVRIVSGDRAPQSATAFIARRVRPIIEMSARRLLDFRIVPDFGQNAVAVFDAHVDLRFHPVAELRAGKFKPPLGLERLQGAADLLFVERAMPTNLIPQRDIGIQFSGRLAAGVLTYTIGAFNGALDLGTGDGETDNRKDVDARVFAMPFLTRGPGMFRGLGLGIAASRGVQQGSVSSTGLPAYRSPAQQVVFAYRADGTAAGTTVAAGDRTRLAPQAYLYAGPFGVLAEYTTSAQRVARGTEIAVMTHSAWQLATSYVVAGGKASFRSVTPTHSYDRARGSWGALEIAARLSALRLDPDAFTGVSFADSSSAISQAHEIGVGVNWHLAPGIKIVTDAELTRFRHGAPAGNRPPERALLMRVQHAF